MELAETPCFYKLMINFLSKIHGQGIIHQTNIIKMIIIKTDCVGFSF